MANFLDLLAEGAVPGDFRPPVAACGPWVLAAPEEVVAWHQTALEGGARVIRTATLGANSRGLLAAGLGDRVNEINWTAARMAVEAAEGSGATVLGWVGPSGAEGEEVGPVFREQLGALLDGGCRVILFEGFSDVREMEVAVETLRELHHCPALVLGPGGVGEEELAGWRERAERAGADAFGVWWADRGRMVPGVSVVAVAEGVPELGGGGLFLAGMNVGPGAYRGWVKRLGEGLA